ncbi:hypothetical protein A6A04_02670 [Paramagnetospirillum marisnigri]|uniref:Uncharacterized protein n=1 Tax=Paramagnetospirillum marisnigri TaxID=1285242 RepID=A0A178MQD2_9PROT|nr:hypothetical protein A6A04_02670 [Paramagnetospirillum marisnigri]
MLDCFIGSDWMWWERLFGDPSVLEKVINQLTHVLTAMHDEANKFICIFIKTTFVAALKQL